MTVGDDYTTEYRNDARSSEELIRLALAADPDADWEAYWRPVACLQFRLPKLFDSITRLAVSDDIKSRATVAAILGQKEVSEKFAPGKCIDLLLAMLVRESSDSVTVAIAFALRHYDDSRCLPTFLLLSKHTSIEIRYAATHGLSGYTDERAIQALIDLSADPDAGVRDWATYSLGSNVELDTPEIRETLFARLEDVDGEVRAEALCALAQRRDSRAIAPLLLGLESLSLDDIDRSIRVVDAAKAVFLIGEDALDKTWLPVLEKMRTLGVGDKARVESAIQSCAAQTP